MVGVTEAVAEDLRQAGFAILCGFFSPKVPAYIKCLSDVEKDVRWPRVRVARLRRIRAEIDRRGVEELDAAHRLGGEAALRGVLKEWGLL